MAVATNQVKPLQLWAGRIGHFFLVLASIVTALAGWIFGGGWSNPAMGFVLGCVFGACPWAVAYLLPFVSIARQHGRNGLAAAMALGVVIAGGMELRGELMIFAGKRAASSTEATLQNARLNDVRNSVSDLEARRKVLQAKLEEQSSHGPSAAYQARIEALEGLAARESSKERRGCQKRCDEAKKEAADLRAKQAIALDRETNTEPQLKEATAELAKAREIASTTKAGDSMTVAESETLASLWTASLNPSADSKKWADLMSGLFMAVFLLVVPTMLVYASKMDWDAPKPVRRAGSISHMIARLSAWLRGEEMPATSSTQALTPIEPTQPQQQPSYGIQVKSLADVRRKLALAAG